MTNATKRQIGGSHYASLAIQPMEYALKNDLNYAQANAVKYITRYKSKGGVEDLRKAIHCLELLIEHEMQADAIDEMAFKHSPDFDESRIDIIGQNGNDGVAYEWAFAECNQDVVHVNSTGAGNYYFPDYYFHDGKFRNWRYITSAPVGRYIRQDNGLYRIAVSE